MIRKWILGLIVSVLLATLALPVLAAPGPQDEGGVHFGPYTLDADDTVSGDLTVFGGPVTLKNGSSFNGDLTVFGPVEIEESALVDGTLVVIGEVDIAGTVDGDVFSAGALTLRETASVDGDVSAVGSIDRAEGAIIQGDIIPVTDNDFEFGRTFPIDINVPNISRRPMWLDVLWSIVRAVASVLVLSLLALMIVSVWPENTERVGRAVEEAPLTAFGMGLLVFLGAAAVLTILAITICLSPFAIFGGLAVGVGVLLGWIALGLILGRRILTGIFNQPQPKTLSAAVLGTVLLTTVLALARIFWPLYGTMLFVLMPLAAGASVLTRFGTQPYATHGSVPASVSAPVPTQPVKPGPILPRSELQPKIHEENEESK
jgi:cytoskeletal protein CcmA (bactofilin family)